MTPQKLPLVLLVTEKGILDVEDNLVYKSKDSSFSLRNRLLLLDATGSTLLSVRRKTFSDDTWKSFKGGSDSSEDLLFSAKMHSDPSEIGTLDVTENTLHGTQQSYRVKPTIVADQNGKDELVFSQCSNASPTVMAVMRSRGEETEVSIEPNFDPARVIVLIGIMILGMDSTNRMADVMKSLNPAVIKNFLIRNRLVRVNDVLLKKKLRES